MVIGKVEGIGIAPSGETYSVSIGSRSDYSPSQANSLDNGSVKNILDKATLNGSWTISSVILQV